jgi:predicted enzyme related to lactoylglutathione lyase
VIHPTGSTPIVFLDIAGPDAGSLRSFYSNVFGWETANEEFSVSVAAPLNVAIREDPAEKRLYLGVDDVTARLAEVLAHGGSIDAPRFEVSGVVVLGLFRDPAGNPMGLVEMRGGGPRIP